MQELLIPTTSSTVEEEATDAIPNRSFLYNQETNVLNIKYNDKLHKIKVDPDEDCILWDKDLVIHLNDDIHMATTRVDAEDVISCPVKCFKIHDNGTSSTKSILLLMKYSEKPVYGMSGELFRMGSKICGAYHMSITSNGRCSIIGASTDESKAFGIKAIYKGSYYVGIKFNSQMSSHLYFHGFDTRTEGAMPPLLEDYKDSDITIVE